MSKKQETKTKAKEPASEPKTKSCPNCEGTGSIDNGNSIQMRKCIEHGYPRYSQCSDCGGKGTVSIDYDPEDYRISDNAWGNGGR